MFVVLSIIIKKLYFASMQGLIVKKMPFPRGGVSGPYHYKGAAICNAIFDLFCTFILILFIYLIYINRPYEETNIHLIKIISIYFLFFGLKDIYNGYKNGIIKRKIRTNYYFTKGTYTLGGGLHHNNLDTHKTRVISSHNYFRGKKAFKIGIATIIFGIFYIILSVGLFLTP